MRATGTVSSKGQITIPSEIRERLGLKRGDQLEFVVEGGRTYIRPARGGDNPFQAFAGCLGVFPGGVPEINAWISDLRDEPEPDR